MLTDEQAFSWEKLMNSIRQNGRKKMLTDDKLLAERKQRVQFNRMEER